MCGMSAAGRVACDAVDDALPERRREGVAHARDHLQFGAGDGCRGAPAAFDGHHGIQVAVHHGVGTRTERSASARLGLAMMPAIWRMTPAGLRPRSYASAAMARVRARSMAQPGPFSTRHAATARRMAISRSRGA